MRVIGLAGWSGAGKTTLIAKLVPELVARGVTVSTIKHAHHDFDIDREGADSYRHRAAGASEVAASGRPASSITSSFPRSMAEITDSGAPAGANMLSNAPW